MRRETLHLTLAFIGDLSEEKIPELLQLGDVLAAETHCPASFGFSLDRLGVWPGKRGKEKQILWAGSDAFPSELENLAGKLSTRLHERGYKQALRPFAPHVTLVRNLGELPESGIYDALRQTPQAWQISEFALLRSRPSAAGAAYETLASWKPCVPKA